MLLEFLDLHRHTIRRRLDQSFFLFVTKVLLKEHFELPVLPFQPVDVGAHRLSFL